MPPCIKATISLIKNCNKVFQKFPYIDADTVVELGVDVNIVMFVGKSNPDCCHHKKTIESVSLRHLIVVKIKTLGGIKDFETV